MSEPTPEQPRPEGPYDPRFAPGPQFGSAPQFEPAPQFLPGLQFPSAPSMPPTPRRPVRSLAGLTKAVIALFVSYIVLELLYAVTSALQIPLFDRIIAGETVSNAEIESSDALVGSVSMLNLLVLIALVIVFLVWLFRARYNAEALSPLRHRRSHGWVFGGWFVPVVSFWFPYQVMDDIGRASDPQTRPYADRGAAPARHGLRLGWWWGTYLTYLMLGNVIARIYWSENTSVQQIRDATYVDVLLAVPLGIVAALLAIRMVRRINAMQGTPPAEPSVPMTHQPR